MREDADGFRRCIRQVETEPAARFSDIFGYLSRKCFGLSSILRLMVLLHNGILVQFLGFLVLANYVRRHHEPGLYKRFTDGVSLFFSSPSGTLPFQR